MSLLYSVLCIGGEHYQLGQLSDMDELPGTIEWCDGVSDDIIGSGWFQKNAIELVKILEKDPSIDGWAFATWLDYKILYIKDSPLSDLMMRFENDYIGYYDSEEHFAEEYIKETCGIPDWLFGFIDCKKLASSLLGDYHVYIDGYAFID